MNDRETLVSCRRCGHHLRVSEIREHILAIHESARSGLLREEGARCNLCAERAVATGSSGSQRYLLCSPCAETLVRDGDLTDLAPLCEPSAR